MVGSARQIQFVLLLLVAADARADPNQKFQDQLRTGMLSPKETIDSAYMGPVHGYIAEAAAQGLGIHALESISARKALIEIALSDWAIPRGWQREHAFHIRAAAVSGLGRVAAHHANALQCLIINTRDPIDTEIQEATRQAWLNFEAEIPQLTPAEQQSLFHSLSALDFRGRLRPLQSLVRRVLIWMGRRNRIIHGYLRVISRQPRSLAMLREAVASIEDPNFDPTHPIAVTERYREPPAPRRLSDAELANIDREALASLPATPPCPLGIAGTLRALATRFRR